VESPASDGRAFAVTDLEKWMVCKAEDGKFLPNGVVFIDY